MDRRELDPNSLARDEDWEGNNAAFTCPKCGKVFLVSAQLHKGGRECPGCRGSRGYVVGGKQKGGKAYVEWS
jgi:Zn finger protein HypA/HybF involved in hydrogenase expression